MPCVKGPVGQRLVRGRHVEDCADPEHCPGCQPCVEDHCNLCRRRHADTVCAECLAVVRNDLHTIHHLSARLMVEAKHGRRAYSSGNGVPGGDALVLAAPGASEHGYRAQLAHRLAYGLSVTHASEELHGDPTPPLSMLVRWETRFRISRDQPTDLQPTMDRVASYLDDHLHELVRDSRFPEFAREVARSAHQLEDVLHEGVRPERTRVPCWECGTRLVKVYADQAAHDHWTCPHCGEHYDRGRFDRAKHDHLASKGAERYVSVPDAVATIGRPEQTVRAWIRRGLVDVARDPLTRRLLVWWPHVREQHRTAQERKR